MDLFMISVYEWYGGFSRGGAYHFVIEGDRIVHISRYALQRRVFGSRAAEYIIDLRYLYGKKIIEVNSTRGGIICLASIYPAEELKNDPMKRNESSVGLSFLNGFKFEHLTSSERNFLLTEWRTYYLPMIRELNSLLSSLKELMPPPKYLSLPSLLECQMTSGASYPLSFLIPYGESARKRSLDGLAKSIHQLWLTARILTGLRRAGRLQDLYLNFTQSPYKAVATFSCREGLCSLWYEFDMNPMSMCGGRLWYRKLSPLLREFYSRAERVFRSMSLSRFPFRPDLAVLSGGKSCDHLELNFRVKSIIECKNTDYKEWSRAVDEQVIPYKEIFQPEVTVLASLREVPETVKMRLVRRGVRVVDAVYPGGQGLTDLLNIVFSL